MKRQDALDIASSQLPAQPAHDPQAAKAKWAARAMMADRALREQPREQQAPWLISSTGAQEVRDSIFASVQQPPNLTAPMNPTAQLHPGILPPIGGFVPASGIQAPQMYLPAAVAAVLPWPGLQGESTPPDMDASQTVRSLMSGAQTTQLLMSGLPTELLAPQILGEDAGGPFVHKPRRKGRFGGGILWDPPPGGPYIGDCFYYLICFMKEAVACLAGGGLPAMSEESLDCFFQLYNLAVNNECPFELDTLDMLDLYVLLSTGARGARDETDPIIRKRMQGMELEALARILKLVEKGLTDWADDVADEAKRRGPR